MIKAIVRLRAETYLRREYESIRCTAEAGDLALYKCYVEYGDDTPTWVRVDYNRATFTTRKVV